jgi:hypothetical protein
VRAAGLFNDLRDIATFVRIASTSEISAPAVGEHHLADFYRELASEAAGSPICQRRPKSGQESPVENWTPSAL